MKKGDLKKQEILRTAETLFCKNGYETTSIQDILDILHTSKGSFYHHYASKELLLEEICRVRASELAESVSASIGKDEPPMEVLNRLFAGMMPLTGEKLAFLMMILPVFDLPEGRQIRFSYAESLASSFRDPVVRELERCNESQDVYCPDTSHAADICFLMLNELWYRICLMIIRNEKAGKDTDPSELLAMISAYRGSLERVLSAPFGALRLLNLDDVKFLTEQIHYHWKLQNYNQ